MTLAAQYAQALYDLGAKKNVHGERELVDSLIILLCRKGHTQLLPAIKREYEIYQGRETGRDTVVLSLARVSDRIRFQEEIKIELQKLGASGEDVRVVEDRTLIGGFILKHHDSIVDASYKTRLLSLYRKMINT